MSTSITVTFAEIASGAGFEPEADGKLNLPATQGTADALAASAAATLGDWQPGDESIDLTITGPGPVWGYMAIGHGLHGRVSRLTYAAPNATVIIFSHGV